MRTPMKLELAPEDRTKLERWLKGRAMSDKIKDRAPGFDIGADI